MSYRLQFNNDKNKIIQTVEIISKEELEQISFNEMFE